MHIMYCILILLKITRRSFLFTLKKNLRAFLSEIFLKSLQLFFLLLLQILFQKSLHRFLQDFTLKFINILLQRLRQKYFKILSSDSSKTFSCNATNKFPLGTPLDSSYDSFENIPRIAYQSIPGVSEFLQGFIHRFVQKV